MNSKFAGLGISVEKPARLILSHPINRQPLRDEAGKEAYIEIFSADSAIAAKHQQDIQRRRLNQRGPRIRITPEELEAEAINLLAALTTGWHLVNLNGKAMNIPFTVDDARDLYASRAMAWIREQVDEFAADRGNFSGDSLTS